MHTKFLAICILLFATACAAQHGEVREGPELVPVCGPTKVVIPSRDEPSFKTIAYSQLPANVQMVARLSSRELELQVRRQLPQIRTGCIGASLSIVQEDLVTSGGNPYRRIWLSYVDGSPPDMHGPDSQNIYLWLDSSGAVSDIYVSPVLHPL
jgi:hypothetical protein